LGYSWGTDTRTLSLVEDYVIRAVEMTRRNYHIHSERIYLAGYAEGATLAYRLGLLFPERFGGVISMNGIMPRQERPLFRLPQLRDLRVFIGHGIANVYVPLSSAVQDHRLLYTAGLDVRLHTYPTTHRLHSNMLRDIDRWIMDRVNAE
jgi:phospholipase/carboxylesterase